MQVEIWSDVMCPFCYIGKRKFEKALNQFAHKEQIEVVWKSFQLNPSLQTQPGKSISQYLAETKGWTLSYAKQMNDYVTSMAKEEGLEYDLDKAVVANSFDAHRLLQLAKKYKKGDLLEEQLFKAYFTEGKNTADPDTLLQIAEKAGLDAHEVRQLLQDKNLYKEEVLKDIYEARQVGVSGVPFFVINQKYAVSGAQAPETFLKALNTSWQEQETQQALTGNNAEQSGICTPEDGCTPLS